MRNYLKPFILLIICTICALFIFNNNAKADLVDDLIKKHKLDPKNNPKDQCDLMYMLYNKTKFAFRNKDIGDVYCDKSKEICRLQFGHVYFLKNFEVALPTYQTLIYNDKTKNVLGVPYFNSESDEGVYYPDQVGKDFYEWIKSSGTIFIDMEDNEHFIKYRKEYINNNKHLQDSIFLRLTEQKNYGYQEDYNHGGSKQYLYPPQKIIKDKTSFLRIRGCYIDEFRITKAKKFLNLNYK